MTDHQPLSLRDPTVIASMWKEKKEANLKLAPELPHFVSLPKLSIRSMVGLGRVELPTSPLSGVRSSQLSYRPVHFPHFSSPLSIRALAGLTEDQSLKTK